MENSLNIEGVKYFHFYIGGQFIGFPNVKMKEDNDQVEVFMSYGFATQDLGHEKKPKKMSEQNFRLFLAEVFMLTQDWEERYINYDMMDGVQWGLTLSYLDLDDEAFQTKDRKELADTLVYTGSNAFPDNFEMLYGLLKKYDSLNPEFKPNGPVSEKVGAQIVSDDEAEIEKIIQEDISTDTEVLEWFREPKE